MKKFFMIFAMAMSLLAMSACKDKTLPLVYNVQINGDADEAVNVAFPNGTFEVDGKAGFNFTYGNVTPNVEAAVLGVAEAAESLTLGAALESEKEEVREAAETVQNEFRATSSAGTYYVHFSGYVMEPITGLRIKIDTTFTNRLLAEPVAE